MSSSWRRRSCKILKLVNLSAALAQARRKCNVSACRNAARHAVYSDAGQLDADHSVAIGGLDACASAGAASPDAWRHGEARSAAW